MNAHLNSLLQTPGTDDQPAIWPSFHSLHIAHIVDALNEQLPSHYIALSQQSLQIRSVDDEVAAARRPIPDVSVLRHREAVGQPASSLAIAPTWEANIADVLEPVKQPSAAVIYELMPQGKLGRVVTRMELLSPSNKPRGSHYETYAVRRVEAVDSDVPLVEIDYLHESPSVVTKLPLYPSHPDAYPYSIVVTDPRPNWAIGKVRAYGFGLGEPVKTFPLPLADSESLDFDLNVVYQRTFRAGRWNDLLDYRVEPERFDTYSPADQQYIRQIIETATR
jgi:hypothetical protein